MPQKLVVNGKNGTTNGTFEETVLICCALANSGKGKI